MPLCRAVPCRHAVMLIAQVDPSKIFNLWKSLGRSSLTGPEVDDCWGVNIFWAGQTRQICSQFKKYAGTSGKGRADTAGGKSEGRQKFRQGEEEMSGRRLESVRGSLRRVWRVEEGRREGSKYGMELLNSFVHRGKPTLRHQKVYSLCNYFAART